MKFLSIDPGTTSMGLAYFDRGYLQDAYTITMNAKAPFAERYREATQALIKEIELKRPHLIVCEEPYMQGIGRTQMQRLLGFIQALPQLYPFILDVHFIHPLTLKSFYEAKKSDKRDLAQKMLSVMKADLPINVSLVSQAILKEQWDITDAVALGVMAMKQRGEVLYGA